MTINKQVMTLSEAIQQLDDFISKADLEDYPELIKALKLGIEAMKHIQWERKYKALR